MTDHASWMYAVVPAAVPPPAVRTGIAGEPVRLVERGDLAAVVGSVSLAEVAEESLRQHLTDPEWLERTARRHHQVIASWFAAVPTVPFRLATVYQDDDRVAGLLTRRQEDLAAALAAVAGRAEWGAQVYAGEPPPGGGDPGSGDPDRRAATGGAGPGTAYLLRQQARRQAREQARHRARDAAQRIGAALAGAAVDARYGAPATTAERPDSLLLHATYLVAEHDREEFLGRGRELAARHSQVELRMTGPWPAYSFVEIREEDL